jgi:hypothetical protein
MLADFRESLSTIHLHHNIVSISYASLRAKREKGNKEG